MPYIHDYEYRPDEGYQYQQAHGQFSIENFDRYSREVFEILQQLNVKRVRCSYNGGGDEGFAHFEEAMFEDSTLSINTLKQQLVNGPLSNPQRQDHIPYTLVLHQYNALTPEERVRERLDAFAQVLAMQLLGYGYGTGDLSIYGSFCAEFETGNVIDEQEQTS